MSHAVSSSYGPAIAMRSHNTQQKRFQFRIRSLLVLMTLCAVLLGWWRDHHRLIRQLKHERERVRAAVEEVARTRANNQRDRDRAMVYQRRLAEMRARIQQQEYANADD